MLKSYRTLQELPDESIRALQSKVSPDERALACGLMQHLPLPRTAEDRDHMVFACRFAPLAAGDELAARLPGADHDESRLRHVYVQSYRDVEGEEFYTVLHFAHTRY